MSEQSTGNLHYWSADLNPLAKVCVACGRPMVPSPAPDDWREHLSEWGNAANCAGSGMYIPTPTSAPPRRWE